MTGAAMGENTYMYAYDPIGNRTGATSDVAAVANALNPYNGIINFAFFASSRETLPVYDPDGSLLASGPWADAWDAEIDTVLP